MVHFMKIIVFQKKIKIAVLKIEKRFDEVVQFLKIQSKNCVIYKILKRFTYFTILFSVDGS